MKPAVVLMAYGSPSELADIRPYLEDIRSGRPVSDEAVEELTERYRRIGGRSPLDEVTERQRAALEQELSLPVFVGMKHWRPRISEAVERALSAGARQRSSGSCSRRTTRGSRSTVIASGSKRPSTGARTCALSRAGTRTSHICDVLADRVRGTEAHVVFTAHSLPARILDEGDPYRDQLLETSRLVAEKAGLDSWSFAFQSASPTGEPWLGPDILEELDSLHERGVERVLVCPIGFVSDHLEILWDIDVEARERAAELGLRLERIESLNDDPAFIRGLAELVQQTVSVPSTR